MAFIHGRDTVVHLNAVDLSAFINNTVFTASVDSHDVTTYGKDGHTFAGGLTNGTVTISGVFDNGASSPAYTIMPLMVAGQAPVTFVFNPEGEGTGKAQRSCSVLVTSYTETDPVADMISWSASLQISGDVDDTDDT